MYHGVANFHQHNFDRCVSKAAELQLKELKGGTEKQSWLKTKHNSRQTRKQTTVKRFIKKKTVLRARTIFK